MQTLKPWMLGPLFVVACAGTKVHDVGDIPGDAGAGVGGSGDSGDSGGSDGVLPPTKAGGGDGEGGAVDPGSGGIGEPPYVAGAPASLLTELECAACEVVTEAPDIRDVATGAEQVYWIEYGTFDELDNHRDDGRLMALPLAGGEPESIATDLQGPLLLDVSEAFAYVVLDRSAEPTGERQLLRVSLSDGEQVALQDLPERFGGTVLEPVTDWSRRFLAINEGIAYWAVDETVYRLAEDAQAGAEPFLETDGVFALLADATQLYVYDVEGIKTVPYGGGAPVLVRAIEPINGFPAYAKLTHDGDFIYGYDELENSLSRLPKAGGSWKRMLDVEYPNRVIVEGDGYFLDPPYRPQRGNPLGGSLLQGSFMNLDSEVSLAIGPFGPAFEVWRGWDVTADSVYFGYGNELYRVPRAD